MMNKTINSSLNKAKLLILIDTIQYKTFKVAYLFNQLPISLEVINDENISTHDKKNKCFNSHFSNSVFLVFTLSLKIGLRFLFKKYLYACLYLTEIVYLHK